MLNIYIVDWSGCTANGRHASAGGSDQQFLYRSARGNHDDCDVMDGKDIVRVSAMDRRAKDTVMRV